MSYAHMCDLFQTTIMPHHTPQSHISYFHIWVFGHNLNFSGAIFLDFLVCSKSMTFCRHNLSKKGKNEISFVFQFHFMFENLTFYKNHDLNMNHILRAVNERQRVKNSSILCVYATKNRNEKPKEK